MYVDLFAGCLELVCLLQHLGFSLVETVVVAVRLCAVLFITIDLLPQTRQQEQVVEFLELYICFADYLPVDFCV